MSPSNADAQRQAAELLILARRDQVAAAAFKSLPEIDFSIIAFHAQQCIEKCMKAALAQHGITYPRTHDLDDLYKLLSAPGLAMPVSRESYAVTSRYEVDKEDLVTYAQIDEAVATTVSWATTLLNPP